MKAETEEKIQKAIEENFDTRWYVEDFIGAYKQKIGLEPDDELSEEQEEEFMNIMNGYSLSKLRDSVIEEANERISVYIDDKLDGLY